MISLEFRPLWEKAVRPNISEISYGFLKRRTKLCQSFNIILSKGSRGQGITVIENEGSRAEYVLYSSLFEC